MVTDRDGDVKGIDTQWRKPVALLVDENTRSGKELLAWGFLRYGYGQVIGQRTAGAVMMGLGFPIGRNALLLLAVLDLRVDGERLEGHGVTPSLEVVSPLPYSQGRDLQLERSIGAMGDQINRKLPPDRVP